MKTYIDKINEIPNGRERVKAMIAQAEKILSEAGWGDNDYQWAKMIMRNR